MTTGDEEAEGLVDDLFRDVDEQFDDLEREYSQARQDLAETNPEAPSIEVPNIDVAAPSIEAPSIGAPSIAVPSAEIPSIEVPLSEPSNAQLPNRQPTGSAQVDAVTPAEASTSDALSIEVDDQFADLEREYIQAREELVATRSRRNSPSDALEASTERFELVSQVATLRAEVSRQADELDERDRMLNELGGKITGFEAEIALGESVSQELHAARQQTLEERREQARLSALLDARAAERQELADVANRLQHDRDHIQELLNTALARHDDAESRLAQMDDKIRHIEAERDTGAHEHEARAHELIESRAEMSKLSDRLDDMAKQTAEAHVRAEKAEALAERRANEASYLNRRIAAMTEKIEAADSFEDDANNLRRELTIAERRITDLERQLASEQSESAAARAAVETIAERTSDYDELVATNDRLRMERDEASTAASGPASTATLTEVEPVTEPSASASSLAERAHELSARRANEAAMAAEAAEVAAARQVVDTTIAVDELEDLDNDDLSIIDNDLDRFKTPAGIPAMATEAALPRVLDTTHLPETEQPAPAQLAPEPSAPEPPAPAPPSPEPPAPAPPAPEPPALVAPIEVEAGDTPQITMDPAALVPAAFTSPVQTPSLAPAFSEERKRAILPAHLEPNTPEAVAHLLNQPGVTAIVDARSTCGRTGIRPSELFERVAALRDFFDVPVEVVVTPVSTPVGGAPDLPAIGVHHITGADTVADCVRALCMGFPADQPLVVIAGDDHVRRAAIGQQANVVEPAAVLNLSTP